MSHAKSDHADPLKHDLTVSGEAGLVGRGPEMPLEHGRKKSRDFFEEKTLPLSGLERFAARSGDGVRSNNASAGATPRGSWSRESWLGLVFLLALALLLGPMRQVSRAASPTDPLNPAACRIDTVGTDSYVVCHFDMHQNGKGAQLRLFLNRPDGKPYGSFASLVVGLQSRGEILMWGMNGGMFQKDLRPLGLYIEAGRTLHRIDQRGGAGNFHMKPNGVFYFGGHSAGIMETSAFVASGIKPRYATQSGPMLVINGKIHPKLRPDGTSAKIRNGVGIRDGHIVYFAISEDPVTFYHFASLFRDRLKCPNALYLDGSVSSLYEPELGRADGLRQIGPIIGIVEKSAVK